LRLFAVSLLAVTVVLLILTWAVLVDEDIFVLRWLERVAVELQEINYASTRIPCIGTCGSVKKTAEVKLKGPKGQSMVNTFVIRMHSVTTSRTKFNSGGNGTPNREITYTLP
jgi:hypothetical protein